MKSPVCNNVLTEKSSNLWLMAARTIFDPSAPSIRKGQDGENGMVVVGGWVDGGGVESNFSV